MGRVFTSYAVLQTPPYVGPGNVVPNAINWTGLRAYTAANIGAAIVRLRRDKDNSESDFNAIAGGGLDMALIESFRIAAGLPSNLWIAKLYDQTGNGNHVVQATAANQPQFNQTALGSLPGIVLVNANNSYMQNASGFTNPSPSRPFSHSFVSIPTFVSTFGTMTFGVFNPNTGQILHGGVANNWNLSLTSMSSVTVSDNVAHAAHVLYDAASAFLDIDGTTVATGTASQDMASTNAIWGFGDLAGHCADATIFESGWWDGDKSSNFSALNTNQHSYWGF